MDKTHLDLLRKLIGDVAPEGRRDARLQEMIFVAGGMRTLEPYVGTAFVGCPAKYELPTLYGLVIALKRLGCPLLVRKGEQLAPDEFPGEVWVTFVCSEERAETLEQVISREGNCALHKVSDEIYVLAGQRISDALPLSLKLEELAVRLRGDREEG